jgi:formate hydrogenlyase transcriptional activator
VQRAAYAQPGLILLDILMPSMDGFATCAALKACPDTQHFSVIFMTALTETAQKVRGLRLWAFDYITKPFQSQEVLARATTKLTLPQLQNQLRESEERPIRIFASAMDAIMTLDQHGQITLFNAAAEQVFHCPAAAALAGPLRGNGRGDAMRHNEDRNLLKTRILERTPQQSIPCGVGHASGIQLVANQ